MKTKEQFWLLLVLAAIVTVPLVLTGCDRAALAQTPRPLPGLGKTVTAANGLTAEVLFWGYPVLIGLERLGYTVEDFKQMDVPAMHVAVGTGDIQFLPNSWDPLQNTFYDKAGGNEKMEKVGMIVTGANQGYLIDKKTADKYDIRNIAKLKDPAIAKLFDSNRDGKADLTGCNPGWGCERVIEHHLDAYGLRPTVQHVQGSYYALMADTIARFQRGEPILFYTWTPLWVLGSLRPGIETEWLQVPFTALPAEQLKIFPDTTLPDGRNLGFGTNDIYIIANKAWLQQNPAARALFQQVKIPLDEVMAYMLLMRKGGVKGSKDVRRYAEEWIAKNQVKFDGWIQEALKAAK